MENSETDNLFKPFSSLNKSGKVSDDITEMTQLRPRGAMGHSQPYTSTTPNKLSDNIVLLEREILPSDTLQSFALRYGCSVSCFSISY